MDGVLIDTDHTDRLPPAMVLSTALPDAKALGQRCSLNPGWILWRSFVGFMLPKSSLWGLLAFSYGACLAAPVTPGASVRIDSLTSAEALAAYREAGEIEAFQCIHLPVGKDNRTIADAKPIAVEFDQKIYVRIDGTLLGLDWVGSTLERSRFSARAASVEVMVLSRTSSSEYVESEDRLMRLQVRSGNREISVKTFGAACGV